MKNPYYILSVLLAALLPLPALAAGEPAAAGKPAIIPAAAGYTPRSGVFVINQKTAIIYQDAAAAEAAEVLKLGLAKRAGLHLSAQTAAHQAAAAGNISLVIVPADTQPPAEGPGTINPATEGYTLEIAPHGATLRAASATGLFYGAQTLLQLAESRVAAGASELSLPALLIEDQPRYAWRGVLLDESRHFFGKQTVLQLLDMMAYLKLNRFHWHLTDEPGWRIEIKKYPKLTTVGSIGSWSDLKAPSAFYTQDDIREIVAYAQQRHIVVVPEIDMPGHATAACRSYPELSGGGAAPWVDFTFNPAREQTYRFLEDVLREVVALFPGPYLHLGGDEVHFGNQSWSTDPEIVNFTRAQGLKDAVELEHYFIRRMANFVKSLGKTVMGWDEIAGAGVPNKDSIVIWWRPNKPEVLETLFKKDYTVVLSPRLPLYFDFVQHDSHQYGRRWENRFTPLEHVYDFPDEATKKLIPPGKESNILGIEACIWTERIQNSARLWYMTLPRLAAFAETAWTPAISKDRPGFIERLPLFLRELDRRGLPYFNPFDPAKTPEPIGPTKKAEGTANG